MGRYSKDLNVADRDNLSVDRFYDEGYVIVPGFFDKKEMDSLFHSMYNIAKSLNSRQDLPINPNEERTLKNLDNLLFNLYNTDKGLIGELYDIFSYSVPFLKFISSDKLEETIQGLLKERESNLYCYTNRCRIDPPNDNRRTYGWHQEVFYTIPKSNFLQTWAPLFRNTRIENGTIEIARSSNKEGIALQSWNDPPGRATQIIVDEKVMSKYETFPIEMDVCDLLIFMGTTMHRSGNNSSDEIRYSLVGMYHDSNNPEFFGPKPDFQFRNVSARQYYDSIFQ